MQQLQENIKKDLIKHPFGNIEIIYEAGKSTMTAQDEELLAAYIRLHDFELEMKNTAGKLYRESIPINETIDNLHDELKKVQATFDVCCALADKLSEANYVLEETSLEKLAQSRKQTEKELKAYNEKILEIYETAKALQKKVNKYNKADEKKVEALYSEFATLSMDHISNWENNAINCVAFDDQFDKFREYRAAVETQRESLLSACTKAMNNYIDLNHQTTALFKVWNEFIKRCELLTKVSDLHTKATGFTEN
jgi:DNA repair exonuclease SbcCD ATPase subunit